MHGTLVVNTRGGWVVIDEAALIQPFRADYPTMIVKGNIELRLQSDAMKLNETTLATNFNPSVAPYEGASDADTADLYPNEIHGLVHATEAITCRETSTVRGVVLAEGTLSIEGDPRIAHDRALYTTPPHGYAKVYMFVSKGSWRRITSP